MVFKNLSEKVMTNIILSLPFKTYYVYSLALHSPVLNGLSQQPDELAHVVAAGVAGEVVGGGGHLARDVVQDMLIQ